jgi:hypothetical protein
MVLRGDCCYVIVDRCGWMLVVGYMNVCLVVWFL